MIYPLYSFEQLDAMEPTTRLKTLRELMRAKDPTFDNYMRRAADKVIEHYRDTQRHLEDVYQDSFEGAFVEASIHDKVRQALFAVDPTNPALDAVPPSYGVWETQRARITELETALAAMTAERDESGRRLGEFQLRLAGALIASEGGNGCPDGAIECIRTCPTIASVMRLRAELDARDVAIGVLAGECFEWRLAHVCSPVSLIDAPIIRARKRTMNNPIARAAVEHKENQ